MRGTLRLALIVFALGLVWHTSAFARADQPVAPDPAAAEFFEKEIGRAHV